jgi:hypothetical protein
LLHVFANCIEKADSWPTVYHAVVKGKTQSYSLSDGNLAMPSSGFVDNTANAQDGALREVDDRRESINAVHP